MLYGSNMNYLEFVIGNSATNTNATVGLVLSNSNTTLSNWYGEIGYNGSGFSSITNPPGGSNDMYIITQGNNTNGAPSGGTNGNNIWIAAMPTNSSIYFGAGTSGKVFNSGVTSKGVFSSDFSTTNVFAYASNSAVGITNNFGYDVEISYYSGVTNVTLFNPSASLVWGPTTNTGAFSFVLRNGWRLTNASCNYEVTP
jgi:hypothetical protein